MPQTIIEGPTRTPVPFGLFSVLTFPTGNERWEMGATWEGVTCGLLNGLGPLDCQLDEGDDTGLPREYANTRGWGEAEAFGVYGSYQCAPVGYSFADAANMAGEDLTLHEEATVEDILWHGHYGQAGLTTIESFGDFDLKTAFAEVEHRMAREYGSQGVIHVPRRLGLLALSDGVLEVKGQRLSTKLGTPVVAGSGYSETDSKIVGVPPMVARRSEIIPLGDPTEMFDRGQNLVTTVAERSYLIGYDPCEPYAAGITL